MSSVGGGGPIQRLQQAWGSFKAQLPSMPKMNMPSKAEVGQKLNDLKGKFTKENLQGAANSAGKGLKKGGGYILMGGGILVGSKYGGDTAVKHGAKLADKEVESDQYASYKRAKTGLKIKKGWASLVKGFGKKMEQIGHDIAHSPKVADQSKTYKMASKLEGHGWSMAYDANEMKTKTEERIEKHQELRKAKIQELQNARISPEEKEIQQHFESANEKLGSIEFNCPNQDLSVQL